MCTHQKLNGKYSEQDQHYRWWYDIVYKVCLPCYYVSECEYVSKKCPKGWSLMIYLNITETHIQILYIFFMHSNCVIMKTHLWRPIPTSVNSNQSLWEISLTEKDNNFSSSYRVFWLVQEPLYCLVSCHQ